MKAKIPVLAWGMLLALATGPGAQEQSLAAPCERYSPLGAAVEAQGLLDGVGIQGHWSIHLTELDLSVYRWGDESSLPELPAELAERQARSYGEMFAVLRKQAGPGGPTAVTFRGLADEHAWLDDFPVRGPKDWPLPFEAEHRPKQAFWALLQW